MTTVHAKNVCIIGAGNSGLGAAKTFKARGHDVTVIERSHDLGGVWEPSRSYPDVQTQTPGDIYSYSDFPMPDHYPEWPNGQQMYDYFRRYAAHYNLLPLIRFNTTVKHLQRRTDAPGWHVELEHDGETTVESFDFVVICTGLFSEPKRLRFAGHEDFIEEGGSIMHSSDYTDPAIVAGKQVLVLGFSKSATDVAVNAVENGAETVTIVYRKPVWRIPYYFGNRVNFKHILYSRIAETLFKPWNTSAVGDILYTVARPLIRLNWRILEALLTFQFKLDEYDMRPDTPIEEEISCGLPIATPGFFDMVQDGRIRAVQSTIDHYTEGTVVLENKEAINADIVIMAVGWQQNMPYLPEAYQNRLIDTDGQYRLYRWIVNPDVPDMGFVGYNSSFASTLTAEISANWLVRYMDNQLVHMPDKATMNSAIDNLLAWRRDERPVMANYGGLCVAPHHFQHLDSLLNDMGAETHRNNPVVAQAAPLNPLAYESLLASAPAYQVQS